MSPRITVFPDKFRLGWPEHADDAPCDRHYGAPAHSYAACQYGIVSDLASALAHRFSTDAHFVAYARPELDGGAHQRRLGQGALELGTVVTIEALVLDLDDESVHGTPEPASETWRVAFGERLAALAAAHPDPYAYFTRGGARLIYSLREPEVLRSAADRLSWARDYAIAVAYMSRGFDLVCDPCCADWTRHYRLPLVTRDGELREYGAFGDPSRIGTIQIAATRQDVEQARVSAPSYFRAPRIARTFASGAGGQKGILYYALLARGHVLAQRDRGWVVRCPNDGQHSCGSVGDSSTLLYPPQKAGDEVGAIHCMHGHCRGKDLRWWLQFFSEEELASARRAAGLPGVSWNTDERVFERRSR